METKCKFFIVLPVILIKTTVPLIWKVLQCFLVHCILIFNIPEKNLVWVKNIQVGLENLEGKCSNLFSSLSQFMFKFIYNSQL